MRASKEIAINAQCACRGPFSSKLKRIKQSGEKNLTRMKSQEKKLSQNLSARKRIRKPGKKLLSFKLNLFKFHLKCFHGV